MNDLKVPALLLVTLMALTGCGQKEEKEAALPADQILVGNAILASQPLSEAHLASATQATGSATVLPGTPLNVVPDSALDLNSSVPEKPTNKNIQQALKNAGLYNGTIDGSLGPKSKNAIREFQQQNGLSPDGKVGPRTWKKLSAYLGGETSTDATSSEISN